MNPSDIHVAPTGAGELTVWCDIDPMFSGTFDECMAFIAEGREETTVSCLEDVPPTGTVTVECVCGSCITDASEVTR